MMTEGLMSGQGSFIYIVLYTVQIVSKPLYSVKQENIVDNARGRW